MNADEAKIAEQLRRAEVVPLDARRAINTISDLVASLPESEPFLIDENAVAA